MPESTMIRLEPRLRICSATRACAPAPMAIIVTTAPTPMMTPSMVSAVRSRLVRSAATAIWSVAPRSSCRASRGRAASRSARPAGLDLLVTTQLPVAEAKNALREARRCPARASPARWSMPGPVAAAWNIAMISTLVRVSRLPVGSSARSRIGSLTRARAMATRCCSPPESWAGRWSAAVGEPDRLELAQRPVRGARAGDVRRRAAAARRWPGRRDPRQQVELLEHEADACGCGSPPVRRRRALDTSRPSSR